MADFDGRKHLISGSNCCNTHGFHTFRQRPDGSWEPRRDRHMGDPDHDIDFGHGFVAAADYDGDGVPDLLMLSSFGKEIQVALGPWVSDEPKPLSAVLDLQPKLADQDESIGTFAVADWDGDGQPDLIAHLYLKDGKSGLYCYRNLGGPGLTRLGERKLLLGDKELNGGLTAAARPGIRGFCVGDWNGDGRPDVIVTRQELPPPDQDGKQEWKGSIWLYRRE